MMEQINLYVSVIGYSLVVLVFLCVFLLYIYQKKSFRIRIKDEKSNKKKIDKLLVASNMLGYYDIKDTPSGGIVIKEKNKKFLAYLSTIGSEWDSAAMSEKLLRMQSEEERMNTIDKPMMIYQYSRPVRIGDYIERFEKRRKELIEETLNAKEDFEILKSQSSEVSDEDYDAYYREVKRKRREVFSLDWKRKNLEMQIEYLKRISEKNSVPENCIIYVLEWEFDQFNFTDELSEDEIWQQAIRELNNKSKDFIDSISSSGVFARRMTRNEIIQAIRTQTNPFSYKTYDIDTILKTDAFEPIVTSDSAKEAQQGVMLELKQEKELQDYVKKMDPEKWNRYQKLANQDIRYTLQCDECGKKKNYFLKQEQYERLLSYLKGNGTIEEQLFDFPEDFVNHILTGMCEVCMEGGN